jgi:hypothetical protein
MTQYFPGFEVHYQTPYFAEQRETVKDWCDGRAQSLVCAAVFPTQDAWKALKG